MAKGSPKIKVNNYFPREKKHLSKTVKDDSGLGRQFSMFSLQGKNFFAILSLS